MRVVSKIYGRKSVLIRKIKEHICPQRFANLKHEAHFGMFECSE